MTQTQQQLQTDDTALKAKHAAMWAMGDYPAVVPEHETPEEHPLRVVTAGGEAPPAAETEAAGA